MKIKFIHIAFLHLLYYIVAHVVLKFSLHGLAIDLVTNVSSGVFILSKLDPLTTLIMGVSLFTYVKLLNKQDRNTILKSLLLHYLIVFVVLFGGILALIPMQQFIPTPSLWLPGFIIDLPFEGYIEMLYLLGFVVAYLTIKKIVKKAKNESVLDN